MQLPAAVLAARARFVVQFHVPQIDVGEALEVYLTRVRAWTQRLAEQIAHDVPDQGYGLKRGDPGRPVCKDCLAQHQAGGPILSWDQLTGAGTGTPTLNDHPESEDVSDQTFVPVTPINHLAGTYPFAPPVDPPTTDPPPAGDDTLLKTVQSADQDFRASAGRIEESLGRVELEQSDAKLRQGLMAEQLDALQHPAPVDPPTPPDYTTRVFGQEFTSKPKP